MMRVSAFACVLVVVVTTALVGCGAAEQKKPPAPPPRPVDVLSVVPTAVRDTGDYPTEQAKNYVESVRNFA